MRLQDVMSTEVVTIGPDEPADAAWSLMERKRIRHLLVTEGRSLIGVISARDLGGPKGRAVRRNRTVRELMTAQTASATPRTTLRQAANVMRGRLIGSLPVLEDGRIVGIVTATDVLEELGRGSSRPIERAQRRSMRLPPASARRSAGRRVAAAKRERRATRRAKRGGKAADSGGREDRPAAITGRITPSLGRERERSPDSRKRAPVADRVPRAAKRASGRPVTEQIPAYIRATDSVIDEADKNYLRRKLGRKLGKFARAIERISVRVEDVNGPRGGVDKSCRIKVVLSGLPSVHVEERHHAVQAAMDRALARTEHAVRQVVQRRRMQPLSQRRSEAAPAYG